MIADRPDSLSATWLRDQLILRLGVSPEQPLTLAYSGGIDSQVLLHLLVEMRRLSGWPIRAIHVSHGISPNADVWVAHCEKHCHAWDVPIVVARVQLTTQKEEGLEAAARRERYRALMAHAKTHDVLLTAQHQRDQAETLMLRLLRGAGCHGLAAMRPRQRLGAASLARPFLDVARDAIEAYALKYDLRWVHDEMNDDLTLARGYLRANIMPALRRFWPATDAQFARTAQNVQDASTLLDEMADADLNICRVDDTDVLSVSALHQLSAPRCRNAIRRWFAQQGREHPSMRHLGRVLDVIAKRTSTAKAAVREGQNEVRRYRDQLYLASVQDRLHLHNWRAPWDPAEPLTLPADAGVLRAVVDRGRGLSMQRLGKDPIHVQFRSGGETCRLPGRSHRHRVKKLLQEAGIPPWLRETLPLVYVGDSLAAIGESWVCTPFAASDDEPSLRLVIDR